MVRGSTEGFSKSIEEVYTTLTPHALASSKEAGSLTEDFMHSFWCKQTKRASLSAQAARVVKETRDLLFTYKLASRCTQLP